MTGLCDEIKNVTLPQLKDSKELLLQVSGYLRGAQTLLTHKKHFSVSPTKKAFLAPAVSRPSILPIAGVDLRLGLLSTEHVFQIIPDVWQGNCQSCL